MAGWFILRKTIEGRVIVLFKNFVTGQVWECGDNPGGVPDSEIIEWIMTRGGPTPGDRIFLEDQPRFVVSDDGRLLQVRTQVLA